MRRVEREIEAVRNDLELAFADPAAPLGHDLLTLRTHSNDPQDTSLASALSGLQFAACAVQRCQEAVKRTEDLRHSACVLTVLVADGAALPVQT